MKDSKEVKEKKIKKERRTFLKRAIYTVPSLIVLGSLVKPDIAGACSNPGPLGECDPPSFP